MKIYLSINGEPPYPGSPNRFMSDVDAVRAFRRFLEHQEELTALWEQIHGKIG